MREATYDEYVRAIQKVLLHVQQNLDDPIDVSMLANVAGYSPFHFHRSFHRLVGEAPISYVRRMRVERAAYQLRNTGESISSIAADTTLGSLAAFTRSFERSFGAPPSRYRKLPWASHGSLPQRESITIRSTSFSLSPWLVEVLHRPQESRRYRLFTSSRCGTRVQFSSCTPPGSGFCELENHGIEALDCPTVNFTHTPRQPSETWKIRGYVGIATNRTIDCADIQPHTIGNGRYVIKRHEGSPRLLSDFWSRAWLEDLFELRVKPRYAPAFNMIVNGFDAPYEEHITDIYIPIQ